MAAPGYKCKGCGKGIHRAQISVLIHVRNGEELGRTEGHYTMDGDVTEDKKFNAQRDTKENMNRYDEIQKSLYDLPDSRWDRGNERASGEAKSGIAAWHKGCQENSSSKDLILPLSKPFGVDAVKDAMDVGWDGTGKIPAGYSG